MESFNWLQNTRDSWQSVVEIDVSIIYEWNILEKIAIFIPLELSHSDIVPINLLYSWNLFDDKFRQ